MKFLDAGCAALLVALALANAATADAGASPPALKAPEGFSVELAAGPPLVDRPIVAAFDELGRLYVAESSGSNDPVEKQLAERPHRILRLEDADGDGKYDRRTVFADHMMFPEGCMFVDGSLYVSAAPSIWKLTDTDGDGVADQRVEWFQGKTLTGCANDLHGPYLGPDGWVYWCKGGFAEQTLQVNGHEFKSRASHIFRCRLDGTGFEPVMTGGMDNPVDVVFTPAGEPILSATFLVGDGRRDGLVHAVYGSMFGKEHGVLDGHPRTGELMPALVLMNPAAPCGLERYDSDVFGADYRDNLFVCEFNLRRVSRHVLSPAGSTFVSADSDFVSSDAVDFHPTDVLMDADGSLLVVNTGGWYKLCCPTSQLWKPDVLGGIYRVRRDGAASPADPRGLQIEWAGLTVDQLWDSARRRPASGAPACRPRIRQSPRVRNRWRLFYLNWRSEHEPMPVDRGAILPPVEVPKDQLAIAALAHTWALAKVESPQARAVTRKLLEHPDEQVRQAALHAVSLYRDAAATPQLLAILASDAPANRRVAAEALGRIGDQAAVPNLLAAAAAADDRFLAHSITYALIELADAPATRAGLTSDSPGTVAAALVALDQMPGGGLEPRQVIPLLSSHDEGVRSTARWIAAHHSEWGGELAQWFGEQLASLPAATVDDAGAQSTTPANADALESLLLSFASHASIQELLANDITQSSVPAAARMLALRVMAHAKPDKPSPAWIAALAKVIVARDPALLPPAIAAARELPPAALVDAELNRALTAVADAAALSKDLRVAALAATAPRLSAVSDPQLALLLEALSPENPVTMRSDAADALAQAPLSASQLDQLCESLKSASALELNRLLAPFERSTDERVGFKLLAALKDATALPSLRVDQVRRTLAGYGPDVQHGVDELESLVNVDAAAQRQRIDALLPEMAKGDRRRGHEVFYSSQAACSSCHRLGYTGGNIGPELSHIGETRTERDLLESILYPSLSFVRSFEPVLVVTVDGRAVNGVVRDQTEQGYVLATGPDQEARIAREDVDEIQPSTTSIMPAGLDKLLSVQQLADLVAFLKNAGQ